MNFGNICKGRLENDVRMQNHIESQNPNANTTAKLHNHSPFNTDDMSKEQQNRPKQPQVVLEASPLNQATTASPPIVATGTAIVATATTTSSSNVIHQTNNKNIMLSSFVSVIEGTKDLSISDEKQRSPKHQHNSQQRQGSSKAMSSLPKQHPLLENTNLNSVEAKLPAAPTVITPKPPTPTIKSGI